MGAHVYLLAANTTGYGQPSVSLLNAGSTGNADQIGAYVLTDTGGSFSITGDYVCSPDTQVYVYALGGNPGAGVNTAAGLLASLGNCPGDGSFAAATPFISINEVSTIAAAYAFAGFATDATHVSSSGTPLAKTGVASAFANAANLADLSSGLALRTNAAGNVLVPQATINTLGNILAACVNSSSSSSASCSTLFANTLSGGDTGSQPADTASAAINMAHHPVANVGALFGLPGSVPPYAPFLASEPNDWTVALTITGGGLGLSTDVAIDGLGSAWITNQFNASIAKISSTGMALSPGEGFTSPDMLLPERVAIDSNGNVWVTNDNGDHNGGTYSISEFSPAGAVLSGTSGFTGGGLDGPRGIAIDAQDNVWIANSPDVGDQCLAGVSKFSSSGVALSPACNFYPLEGGFPVGPAFPEDFLQDIAIEPNGNVWVGSSPGSAVELSNNGTLLSPINSPGNYAGFEGVGFGSTGAAIDGSGNIWFDDELSITEASPNGIMLSPSNGGFVNQSSDYSSGLAMDGAGHLWVAASTGSTANITEISPSGAALTGVRGLQAPYMYSPSRIAVDGSGNIWVPDIHYTSVTEFIGVATPVVTPLAAGVRGNMLGSRP